VSDVLKQAEEALDGLLSIGKRDLTNPKYDGYFEECRSALVALRGLAWRPIEEMEEFEHDGVRIGYWLADQWFVAEYATYKKSSVPSCYTHFSRPILPTPPTREME